MGVITDLELVDPARSGGRSGRLSGGLSLAAAGILLSVAAVAVAAGAFLIGLSLVYADRALPGVRVAGQSVAGLDQAQAAALLRDRLVPLGQGSLSVRVGDHTFSAPLSDLDRDYGVDQMVAAAFAFGHQGGPLERASDEVTGLFRGVDVAATSVADDAAVRGWVLHVAGAVDQAPVDAAAARPTTSGSDFVVTPGQPGTVLDSDALLKAVQAALVAPRPGDISLDLPLTHPAPDITTAEAQAAVARARTMTAQPLTITGAGRTWTIPTATLRSWISFAPAADGTYAPSVDQAAVAAALRTYAQALGVPAQNASWTTSGDRVTGVIPAKPGRTLDVGVSATAIAAALRSGGTGTTPVALLVKPLDPAVTTALAEAEAPKMQVLGQWSTYYTPYIENYYGRNIQIPTTQIDGMVVAPGQWFDFWKRVVISTELGYGPGGEIVNGHSHITGALGGGICSCSTTLFNAALRSGLQMGDRTNHYYYLDRYPVGLDATVYMDEWSTVDMTFRNDMANAILIRGINTLRSGTDIVTFKIFGVPDGRTVSISSPTVKNYRNPTCCDYEDTSSLPKGTTQQVEYPTPGFDAWVTVTVRNADKSVRSTRTYYSHYALVNGVILRGTG